MPIVSATLPPGHYIIADPEYFKEYDPHAYFWTYGDGEFFDNLNNSYYVDSAKIAVFKVEEKPDILPKGTHHFFFNNPWKIDFDAHHLLEQIKITVLSFKDISPNFFDPMPIGK
jgi:hypothetical protein